MVADVPLAVILDKWLRRYPGMTPEVFLNMDWESFLELEAVQRGEAIARSQ